MYSFSGEYSANRYGSSVESPAVTQLLRNIKGTKREHPVMPNSEALSTLEAYRRTANTHHRDRIVKGNILLITKLAHQYVREGVELEDLVQVGIIGFIDGLEKFKFNEGCVSIRKTRIGQMVLVYSRQKVASYAANYVKKHILLYLEEDVPGVRIGRRAVSSAKKAMREMESFVRIHERSVPIDVLLAHRGPAERIGALDVYPARVGQGTEHFEGLNGHPTHFSVQEDFTPEEPLPDERLAQVFGLLSGEDRKMVFAYYGIDDMPFDLTCGLLGLTVDQGKAMVRKVLARVRGQIKSPEITELNFTT